MYFLFYRESFFSTMVVIAAAQHDIVPYRITKLSLYQWIDQTVENSYLYYLI